MSDVVRLSSARIVQADRRHEEQGRARTAVVRVSRFAWPRTETSPFELALPMPRPPPSGRWIRMTAISARTIRKVGDEEDVFHRDGGLSVFACCAGAPQVGARHTRGQHQLPALQASSLARPCSCAAEIMAKKSSAKKAGAADQPAIYVVDGEDFLGVGRLERSAIEQPDRLAFGPEPR